MTGSEQRARPSWQVRALAAIGLAAAAVTLFVVSPSAQPQTSRSAAAHKATVTIDWAKTVRVSKTTPTLQVVVNPPLRRGSAIHDGAFKTLHDLGCEYVRYVPWLPYPKLGIAELEPPAKTS